MVTPYRAPSAFLVATLALAPTVPTWRERGRVRISTSVRTVPAARPPVSAPSRPRSRQVFDPHVVTGRYLSAPRRERWQLECTSWVLDTPGGTGESRIR